MQYFQVIENKEFIDREWECERLAKFMQLSNAAILIVYGRRRVGKTELIEQSFRHRHLLKFEGLEAQPEPAQIQQVLYQLSRYLNEPYIARLDFTTWVEVLDLIADKMEQGEQTLYFEEVQWLANYEDNFISALKYVWDNRLRHNPQLRVILCGSSPSFMVNQVVNSRALYNRSQYELNLQPFTICETARFLPKLSHHEIISAYLTLGGIPEYLNYLRQTPSVFAGICENSFTKDSVFSREYKKIFISSLADNPHYQSTIHYLSLRRFASRAEIAKHLRVKSGGSLTTVLNDLEQCGFIEKYSPFYTSSGRGLFRYCIRDPYLMFYYKFIHPIEKNIEMGQYDKNPSSAINQQSYHTWMGYAFERFIRYNQHLIAKILGFSGLAYEWGVFYNRDTMKQAPGYQIDLLYEHSKYVYTICEIKYHTDLVGPSVISEMERKLALFPNDKKRTIKKVLITTYGVTDALKERAYFDHIITVEDLFAKRYWE